MGGGKNIVFFDEDFATDNKVMIVDNMHDAIVQEVVGQHSSMASFNKTSLNTMRLVTFITKDNDVSLLSTVVRMGIDKNKVDNAGAGGIFCGVTDEGIMRSTAHNLYGDSFDNHPDSKIAFAGYTIPSFSSCRSLVLSLAPRLIGMSRLVSWDLAVGQNGEPILIEANMSFGGCDIPQIANGPLFGTYTESMIKEVFSVKKNRLIARLV